MSRVCVCVCVCLFVLFFKGYLRLLIQESNFCMLVQYSRMHHFGKIDFFGKFQMAYYSSCFHQNFKPQKLFIQLKKSKDIMCSTAL